MSWTIPLLLAFAPPTSGALAITSEAALVSAVLEAHPDIEAAEQRAVALERKGDAMSAWWDPMVGAEYSNMPLTNPVLGSHPMAGVQLKVTQKLPFPGKLGARGAALETAAAAERMGADEARNRLIAQTRMRVVMLRRSRALLAATKAHRTSLGRLQDAIRVRYELGKADQHDVLRLEVLDGKLGEKSLDLEEVGSGLIRELNVMAARDAEAEIDLGSVNALNVVVTDGALARPMLKVMDGRADAARLRADAAAKDGLPDLTAWLGYRIRLAAGADPGDNFVTAGVSLPLPWLWGRARWEGRQHAERAMADGITASRRSLERQIRSKVESARVRHARAAARAKAHEETLIPKARETVNAALNAYQVDRATFADLFQAELDVIELERVAILARAEAALAVVEIDAQTGRGLEEFQR